MYSKFVYKRVNWMNKSESLTTPLGKHNLNNMDSAIYNIAENIDIVHTEMNAEKFDKSDADKVIVGMPTWNPNTGILAFRFYDGTTFQVDFNVEKIPVSFSMNSAGVITMTTSDGTEWTADIGDVIPTHTYTDSDTIAFFDTKDGDYKHTVSAKVKIGSIKEEHIQPKYLADVKEQAAKAAENAELAGGYAEDAAYDAKMAQSYAAGGSGLREGEDSDSAKFYKEEAEKTAKAVEDRLSSMQDVSVTVDSDLNSTSKNPVQNKTLYSKISNIDNTADKDKIVAKAKALDVPSPVGSETEPVYVDADGQVMPCSYTLGEAAEKGVADNLTTASPGTHLLDAYQAKLLNDKIAKHAIYTKIGGTLDTTILKNQGAVSGRYRFAINTIGCPADGNALVFCRIIDTGSDSGTNIRGEFVDAYHSFKTLASFAADGDTHVAIIPTATLYPSTTFYLSVSGSPDNSIKAYYSYVVIML